VQKGLWNEGEERKWRASSVENSSQFWKLSREKELELDWEAELRKDFCCCCWFGFPSLFWVIGKT
jgi:hypothetical protein